VQSKIQKAMRALQKSIQKAQSDPWRPRYHFAPPANWMNDPNGTIYHNGEYHLFYQFNPVKPKWGNLHWGHAKSKDLVHWEHLPIALAPEGFPREMHCWSGCCVIADDGTPTIFYTSMNPRSLLTIARRHSQQWMATSSPNLVTWKKHPGNPILSEAIHGEQIPQQWRDPYVWKENGKWFMVLCGQYPGEKFGSVFLYQSENLRNWDYVNRLYQGSESQGKGWECVNYFKLGGKRVLVISPYDPVIYSVGEFDSKHHLADSWHTLDHGKDFYATNTFIDEQGHTILVGWVKAKGNGWAGCLSLPREIQLSNGNLTIKPIPELEELREVHQTYERKLETVTENAGTGPIYGERVEIKAKYRLKEAESFGFKLIDDEDEHELAFDFQSHRLQLGDDFADLQFTRDSDQIELHIFVDYCVIEIFINCRETFTTLFYPQLAETHALKISPFIKNGRGEFSVNVWKLAEAPVVGDV
jgi:beta-fructofuranosidase